MMKSTRNLNYDHMKANVLHTNQNTYQTIRSQRKSCFDEKNRIHNDFVNRNV